MRLFLNMETTCLSNVVKAIIKFAFPMKREYAKSSPRLNVLI